MTTVDALDQEYMDFCVDSKWLIVKSNGPQKMQ